MRQQIRPFQTSNNTHGQNARVTSSICVHPCPSVANNLLRVFLRVFASSRSPLFRLVSAVTFASFMLASTAFAAAQTGFSQWKRGPSADPSYFPIAVWLQSPSQAARYEAAGVNLYVGLYRGPNEKDLAELKNAGMQAFCSQNRYALAHLDDPTIVGWMQPDEPDNAQEV